MEMWLYLATLKYTSFDRIESMLFSKLFSDLDSTKIALIRRKNCVGIGL